MGQVILIIGAIVAGIAFLCWLFSDKDENSPNFFQVLGMSVGAASGAGCFVFIVEAIIALLPIILIVMFFQSC